MINLILNPKDITINVANNFRKNRKKQKITIKELSKRSGVSYSSIRRFEKNGEISFISLVKIASILNMEDQINELFEEALPTTIAEVLASK